MSVPKIPPPDNNKFIQTESAVIPRILPNLNDDLPTTHDRTDEINNAAVVSNYIGSTNSPGNTNTALIIEPLNYSGISTLNLTNIPTKPNEIELYIDGIVYETPDDFFSNGTVITITNANLLENLTNQSTITAHYV